MSFIEDFVTYVDSDNEDALNIYNELSALYKETLKIFPEEINLLGVYFIDILKFLTHTHFKLKEIYFGYEPSDAKVTGSLNKWPYLGYEDLKQAPINTNKIFGKNVDSKPSKQKLLGNSLANFGKSFLPVGLPSVSCLSFSFDSGNKILLSRKTKSSLLTLSSGWFSIPYLMDQIKIIDDVVSQLMVKHEHKLRVDVACHLIRSHILANTSEGMTIKDHFKDVLLLKSGVELQNRMLGSLAKRKGVPVINTLHGEGFGVYDEPIFSELGEQLYSSALIGYGSAYAQHHPSYRYGMKKECIYLESDGVQAKRFYQPEFKGVQKNLQSISLYYYPTTLSGSSHRYGPYRDTADYLYLKWQKCITDLFGDELIIKAHPKEKYSTSCSFPTNQVITGDFEELLSSVDVFVFDYIGTAFNIACATDKPVIYFDLGIRKISPVALDEIKQRTIYVDIKKGLPTKDEILDQLDFGCMENRFTKNFSLSSNGYSRLEALELGIQKLI